MGLRTGLGGHGDDRITPRHACACTEDRRTCTSNPFAVSEQKRRVLSITTQPLYLGKDPAPILSFEAGLDGH